MYAYAYVFVHVYVYICIYIYIYVYVCVARSECLCFPTCHATRGPALNGRSQLIHDACLCLSTIDKDSSVVVGPSNINNNASAVV